MQDATMIQKMLKYAVKKTFNNEIKTHKYEKNLSINYSIYEQTLILSLYI